MIVALMLLAAVCASVSAYGFGRSRDVRDERERQERETIWRYPK
jgi:hypothetical protein